MDKKRDNGKRAVKDLTPKDITQVRGGVRQQKEFLILKMNDVLITSVNPSGSGDSG